MANVNNTNVYICSSKNRSEWSEISPLKFLVEVKLVNDKIIVSNHIASMILRKNKKYFAIIVLNLSTFLLFFLFHYMQFIFIETALSKMKPKQKLYIRSLEFLPIMLSNENINILLSYIIIYTGVEYAPLSSLLKQNTLLIFVFLVSIGWHLI